MRTIDGIDYINVEQKLLEYVQALSPRLTWEVKAWAPDPEDPGPLSTIDRVEIRASLIVGDCTCDGPICDCQQDRTFRAVQNVDLRIAQSIVTGDYAVDPLAYLGQTTIGLGQAIGALIAQADRDITKYTSQFTSTPVPGKLGEETKQAAGVGNGVGRD